MRPSVWQEILMENESDAEAARIQEEASVPILQAKIRGYKEWEDVPNVTHPQHDLEAMLDALRGHGFKVQETDAVWQIVNPLTKQIECEYRLW